MAKIKGRTGCLPEGYRPACAIRPQSGERLYYIGLGSNLGDRRAHLDRTLSFLAGLGHLLKRSSIYETSPVGMPGSAPFLNMVATLATALEPVDLLRECRAYEAGQGRDLADSHLRDRAIDIDILLAGNLVMNTPELTLPHPRLAERGFVLVPLFEIAPKLVHPVKKITVARLISLLSGTEKIMRIP